jgi:hypothetical protein
MPLTFTTIAGVLSGAHGLYISMLLIGLLALKEFVQAAGGPRARLWARLLQIAILPLLVLFGLSITMRLTAESSGQQVRVSTPAAAVQLGDWLDHVAARFNTTIELVVAVNRQVESNNLLVGQVIQIPAAQPASERQP